MTKSFPAFQLTVAFMCTLLSGSLVAQDQRKEMAQNVQDTIATYRKVDPGIERFFKESAGYVVFPRVGKGGFIIAGGHGDGEVYEKGKAVGAASITLGSVGLTAGAQEFSEIIFFQNQAAVDRFKQNKFEFTANASAVIVKAGASKASNYRDGVVVFTRATAGAMAELSLGTQKFKFKPE